jgi:hypothetical protein
MYNYSGKYFMKKKYFQTWNINYCFMILGTNNLNSNQFFDLAFAGCLATPPTTKAS